MERFCGICDEELTSEDEIVECRECGGLYHLECFEASGGCANPNCKNYKAPSLSLAMLSQDDGEYDDFDDYEENFTVSYANEEDDPFYEENQKKKKEAEKWEFDENYQNDATKADRENPEDYEESYSDEGYGDDYTVDEIGDDYKATANGFIKILGFIGFTVILIVLLEMFFGVR